jgi:hypothetical protein
MKPEACDWFRSLALLPKVKWMGCEADHSPASNAKVKNGNAILLLPHVLLMWCSIKLRDSFTYIFIYFKNIHFISSVVP